MKLQCRVSRGIHQGKILTPHKYKEGHYVVSKDKYKKSYINVKSLHEVYEFLKKGYRVRMGNGCYKISPSLIIADSIQVIHE